MATIRDVSKEAGVSRTTVTRVLSEPKKVKEHTRKKVLEAIEKLQYRPNMLSQTFRNKRTNLIVVLVPNIANPLFAKIVSGIEKTAHTRGYKLLLGNTQNSEELESDYIRLVETQLADGVLQLSSAGVCSDLLASPHIKAISVAGVHADGIPCVMIDNVKAAETVIEHLAEKGHRRIGLVTGPRANANTTARLKGYMNGLQKANIPYDPTLVIDGTFRSQSGLQAAHSFIQMGNARPTAVFCMNDEMAIGFTQGCEEAGLHIPDDMSVVGFDNLDMTEYWKPGLTTVSQPAQLMGEKGFELLCQLLENPDAELDNVTLPFDFIIRNSTKAI